MCVHLCNSISLQYLFNTANQLIHTSRPLTMTSFPLTPTPVVTRYVQTDDRRTQAECRQQLHIEHQERGVDVERHIRSSPPPYCPRPLRERRLPASFWQEPNVPRTSARSSASSHRWRHHSVDGIASGWCCDVSDTTTTTTSAKRRSLCCGGAAGDAATGCCAASVEAAGALHPLHLLQYLGLPSLPAYGGGRSVPPNNHVGPSPTAAVDLAALCLGRLYQSQHHQQQQQQQKQSFAVDANSTAPFRLLQLRESSSSTRAPPPGYGGLYPHRHHQPTTTAPVVETGFAPPSPTSAAELTGNGAAADRRFRADRNCPIDDVIGCLHGGNVSAVGDCCTSGTCRPYDVFGDLVVAARTGRHRLSDEALQDQLAIAAAYLQQQRSAILGWPPSGSAAALDAFLPAMTSPHADTGSAAELQVRCRDEQTACDDDSDAAAQSLSTMQNAFRAAAAAAADATAYGELFPVWRPEVSDALIATSLQRTARRYNPY